MTSSIKCILSLLSKVIIEWNTIDNVTFYEYNNQSVIHFTFLMCLTILSSTILSQTKSTIFYNMKYFTISNLLIYIYLSVINCYATCTYTSACPASPHPHYCDMTWKALCLRSEADLQLAAGKMTSRVSPQFSCFSYLD